MFRDFALFLVICLSVSPGFAEGPKPLASALSAARDGNWQNAAAIAERAGPAALSLISWTRLRSGEGTLPEVLSFLKNHPDWPGLALMRKRAEAGLEQADPTQVQALFKFGPPQTGAGVLALAQTMQAQGQSPDTMLIKAWQEMDLDADSHKALIAQYEALLRPHHEARLDMALWRNLRGDAALMLPLVDDGWQALAKARMGLRKQAKGVDGLISAVPARLRDDPGLAYERFQWRVRKGRTSDAAKLVISQSRSASALGQPARWAGWRRYLVRDLMRDGQYLQAYQVAHAHFMTPADGYGYADLEWLSGYLSVRYLNEPQRALDHFQRFRSAVETPISLGRAGYWIGRAQEAMGNAEAAQAAYAEGAQYQTSFYGLLAAERGGVPFDESLAGGQTPADWRQASFARSGVFQAGILALNAGELSLAEQFFRHLAAGLDAEGVAQLGQMAIDLKEPHLQVMIAKTAAQTGVTLPGPYYALHPMQRLNLPVPMELALSIARRESEFDPQVISGAGAQGLMQLMPGTARQVAQGLGVEHEPAKVLSDWGYNAILGSTYLQTLAEKFDGNIVMISAGYNAGPGRPEQWIERFGDPRNGNVDVIDWIEKIPFTETQNYVMRVAESLPVYRARLGKAPHPVPFSAELTGATIPVQ
ncbi:lytic transglycosylase domain-containing protein [Thalassovita sp.]|jgi:soluble lytic murein transglycosylase|uniref:lytic transglycosylase domain-containing protein n=1 Tax=Thalassovita sp. TaxID=1979401 RepID=UPI003B594286